MKLDRQMLRWVYGWAKKVHNLMVWLMVFLGGVMTVTGWVLHEAVGGEGGVLLGVVNGRWARVVHRSLAQPFGLVLGVMTATGLIMWLFPRIMRKIK